jgi:eukaryotic-like serine/threonine-protein kinase
VSWLSDSMVDQLRAAASWPELDDRYAISGVAGQGGMGTVYVAHDRVLDREVAVKVLDVADRSGARASRILREAHILGRLDHPAIVPVHDAGTLADGRTFYVMKLVRGQRLDQVLRPDGSLSRSTGRKETTLADRLVLFGRVLDAVAFAHSLGIVHRDLKPENIMVGSFGEVYVMDWGVALTTGEIDPSVESPEVIAGTPGFMAPEQERSASVDARADVFALGGVLQHLLPPAAPPPLSAIAEKARQSDATKRYQTVDALAADLARFRNHEPVDAYRESLAERLLRVYRRYELPILLVFAYILMRAVLLIWARV